MNILVVGSGAIGLSTAFELALAGHSVRVVTRNYEEGTSWVAGGMLAPFSEGLEGELLKFSVESLNLYSDFIDRLQDVSKISVYFNRNGILRLALSEEELLSLKERATLYKGMTEVEVLDETALSREEPFLSRMAGVVLFCAEGNVDAEKLMDALIFACENLKVKIIVDDITELELSGDRVEGIKGYRDTYRADFYVFCTGAWSKPLLKVPVFPIKGQILKIKGIELNKVYYSDIAYIIPKENHILIGATSEDKGFDARPTLGGIRSLLDGAIKLIPALEEGELLGVKVGFRPATPDDKPILQLGENYVYSVGHYRNGILWTPVSSKVVLDYVDKGIVSHYFSEFSISRFE